MNSAIKIYGCDELDLLCSQASESARLRQHLNIHSDLAEPCQRLFIAMQPRSYVVPHRHFDPPKSETFIALRGTLGLVFFDHLGSVTDTVKIGPSHRYQVCDIPIGSWHTAIALEANSAFMEVKPGPYSAIQAIDQASWAPTNGAETVDSYLDFLYSFFH